MSNDALRDATRARAAAFAASQSGGVAPANVGREAQEAAVPSSATRRAATPAFRVGQRVRRGAEEGVIISLTPGLDDDVDGGCSYGVQLSDRVVETLASRLVLVPMASEAPPPARLSGAAAATADAATAESRAAQEASDAALAAALQAEEDAEEAAAVAQAAAASGGFSGAADGTDELLRHLFGVLTGAAGGGAPAAAAAQPGEAQTQPPSAGPAAAPGAPPTGAATSPNTREFVLPGSNVRIVLGTNAGAGGTAALDTLAGQLGQLNQLSQLFAALGAAGGGGGGGQGLPGGLFGGGALGGLGGLGGLAPGDVPTYEALLALQERLGGAVPRGTPPAALASLPTRKYASKARPDAVPASSSSSASAAAGGGDDAASSEEVCAVCLSPFEEGVEQRVLPCDHAFHVACVDRWLGTSKQCPCCRRDVV